MAKNRAQKEAALAQFSKELESAKSVVFTTYNALTVPEVESLRNKLREEKVSYRVIKKTLVAKGVSSWDNQLDLSSAQGNLGVALAQEDAVASAKVLVAEAKTLGADRLNIHGGYLGRELISFDKVVALSKLPSKEVLLGQTVATIQAPVSGLRSVLGGVLSNLVNVLGSIKESKV